MAQESKKMTSRTLRRGLRRMGLTGRRTVVIASLVLALGCAMAGAVWMETGSGIAIERGGKASAVMGEEGQQSPQKATTRLPGSSNSGEARDEGKDDERDGEQSAPGASQPTSVTVHVDGAVRSPGVYVLRGSPPRANDAVEMAGGLTEEADTSAINLAAAVADGEKVHVPTAGEAQSRQQPMQAPASDAGEGVATSAVDDASGLVNVNEATTEELQRLPGVGEATATAIVTERENNGPFESVDDLLRVSGIGEKKLAKLRDMACV